MPRYSIRTRFALLSWAALAFAAGTARSQDLVRSIVVSVDPAGRVDPTGPDRIGATKRYWADSAANTIRRSNLDGSAGEDIAIGLHIPYGLGFDVASGALLWTSAEDAVVQTIPASGGTVAALQTEFEEPYALITQGEGFQTAYAILDGAVVRVVQYEDREEEETETLVPYDSMAPPIHGLALDVARGVLYLGDPNGQMTRRLRLADRRLDTLVFVDETFPTSGPTKPPIPSKRGAR